MPLLDHFRPPLSTRRHWHAFHNAWATYLASDLNARLPEGYFAEPNVQFGIEIDVATFEDAGPPGAGPGPGWACPSPTQTVPFPLVGDVAEVLVFGSEGGPTLAGAIELVSPANKDRTASREAFAAKCETYLQQGVGLVVVDLVTGRHANLHRDLLARLGDPGASGPGPALYAVAYRPVEQAGRPSLAIWEEPLALGGPLPTLPLWLRRGTCLPVDLEATYERTRREHRLA